MSELAHTAFNPLRGVFARAIILWPLRQRHGLVRLDATKLDKRWLADFYLWGHASLFPNLTDDEVATHLKSFFNSNSTLQSWWKAAFDGYQIKFINNHEIAGSQKENSHSALTRWRALTAWLDADALWAHHAVSEITTTKWDFATWLNTESFADANTPFELYDQHIHWNGAESIPALWLDLANGVTPELEQIPRYSHTVINSLVVGSTQRNALEREIAMIKQAFIWRRQQCEQSLIPIELVVKGKKCPELKLLNYRADESRVSSYHARAQERYFLCEAWRQANTSQDDEWLQGLDTYLYAKSIFLRNAILHPGTPPGLSHFRRYYEAAKSLRTTRPKNYRETPHVAQYGMAKRLNHLREPTGLSGLELRLGPMDSKNDYYNFFNAWNGIRINESKEQKKLKIRFAIHFKRNPIESELRDQPEYHKSRVEVGKASSVLGMYLLQNWELNKAGNKQLPLLITSVDVASMEAGNTPVEVFAPYIRYLTRRSDPRLELRHVGSEANYVGHWVRLSSMDSFEQWFSGTHKKLRVTYHAGEDYLHPLGGLRNIHDAIEFCEMEANDRIGHGLALGIDIDNFNRRRGEILEMPKGVLLDDLLWLWEILDLSHLKMGGHHKDLYKSIIEMAKYIFGSSADEIEVLCKLRKLRSRALVPQVFSAEADLKLEVSLRAKELNDLSVQARKRELIDVSEKLQFMLKKEFVKLFCAAQKKLIQILVDKKIVVEINPSSNLAIGRFGDLAKHPFFKILKLSEECIPRFSINSDNPGVSATNVGIEYGLMYEAMLRNNIPKKKALTLLTKISADSGKTFFK